MKEVGMGDGSISSNANNWNDANSDKNERKSYLMREHSNKEVNEQNEKRISQSYTKLLPLSRIPLIIETK